MEFNLTEDILINTGIAYQDLVGETIFVDQNPAKVEIVKVSKVNSDIKKTIETKEYKLIHHSTHLQPDNIKNAPKILSNSINKIIIDEIKRTDDLEIIKYKEKKVFGLISSYNINSLLSTINYFNWVIVSNKVFKDLSKLPNFEKFSPKSGISKIGVYNDISFYVSSDLENDSVLLGMSDSITAVFLQDVYTKEKSNIYDIGIDYLFITKGIRRLILE